MVMDELVVFEGSGLGPPMYHRSVVLQSFLKIKISFIISVPVLNAESIKYFCLLPLKIKFFIFLNLFLILMNW